MKKLILIFALTLLSVIGYGQKYSSIYVVPADTTVFGRALPSGTVIIDQEKHAAWVTTAISTSSMTLLTATAVPMLADNSTSAGLWQLSAGVIEPTDSAHKISGYYISGDTAAFSAGYITTIYNTTFVTNDVSADSVHAVDVVADTSVGAVGYFTTIYNSLLATNRVVTADISVSDSLQALLAIIDSNLYVEDTTFIGDSSYIVETTDTMFIYSPKYIKIGGSSLIVNRDGSVIATNGFGSPTGTPLSFSANGNGAAYIGINGLTDNNTIFGYTCGDSLLAAALRNTFIGYKAGFNDSTGYENTFVGMSAGENNSSGSSNVFLGFGAGVNNKSGSDNVFIGADAGLNNKTSGSNIFIGTFSGHNNTTGGGVFIGPSAGYANTTGYGNVFMGGNAGVLHKTGLFNTFIGNNAGSADTSGGYNTLIGASAGSAIKSGGFNICVGASSGIANTTGDQNIYIGLSSGNSNTVGHDNIFIGNYGGYYETGSDKLIIDNRSRTNEATARTSSMIYGVFAADFTTQTLNLNATVNINSVLSLTLRADPPGSPVEGMIYADTDHHIYYYNGSGWVQMDN